MTLHPNAFFPRTHGTFIKINHILGHETNFNKFKRAAFIEGIALIIIKMELEISNRNISEKN